MNRARVVGVGRVARLCWSVAFLLADTAAFPDTLPLPVELELTELGTKRCVRSSFTLVEQQQFSPQRGQDMGRDSESQEQRQIHRPGIERMQLRSYNLLRLTLCRARPAMLTSQGISQQHFAGAPLCFR